jgi:hypothetical protein
MSWPGNLRRLDQRLRTEQVKGIKKPGSVPVFFPEYAKKGNQDQLAFRVDRESVEWGRFSNKFQKRLLTDIFWNIIGQSQGGRVKGGALNGGADQGNQM